MAIDIGQICRPSEPSWRYEEENCSCHEEPAYCKVCSSVLDYEEDD